MNKEEIRHFKSILREASLRHMNILLDDKLQKELQTIIKDYEQLQQENKRQKEVINKAIDWLVKYQTEWCQEDEVIRDLKKVLDILKEVE